MVVWIGFAAFILILLALDLGVFHRKAHAVSAREGLAWSLVWTTLSLAFAGFIFLGSPGRELEERPRPDPEQIIRHWEIPVD